MPIYEYFCSKCALEFELMRPFSQSDKPAKCPKCRSKVQKLVSGFSSKTGSYVQSSAKPFRRAVKKTTKATSRTNTAKNKKITRNR